MKLLGVCSIAVRCMILCDLMGTKSVFTDGLLEAEREKGLNPNKDKRIPEPETKTIKNRHQLKKSQTTSKKKTLTRFLTS